VALNLTLNTPKAVSANPKPTLPKSDVVTSDEVQPGGGTPALPPSITSSSKTRYRNINIMGAPGAGKTFLAASASAKWPAELGEPAVLDDIFWIAADHNALEGFEQYDIEIPYTYDIPDLLTKKGEANAIKQIPDVVNGMLSAGSYAVHKLGCKYIVFDTMSILDKLIYSYWQAAAKNFAVWNGIEATHRKMWNVVTMLPATRLFLFHQDVLTNGADEELTKAKKDAAGQTAEHPIVMSLSTKRARELYMSGASCTLALEAAFNPAKKTMERVVYTRRGAKDTKNRFQRLLDEKEPADLQHIFKKAKLIGA
jgi:hypothetical protein